MSGFYVFCGGEVGDEPSNGRIGEFSLAAVSLSCGGELVVPAAKSLQAAEIGKAAACT